MDNATFAKAPSTFGQNYYQDLCSMFRKSWELKPVGVPLPRSKERDSFDWYNAVERTASLDRQALVPFRNELTFKVIWTWSGFELKSTPLQSKKITGNHFIAAYICQEHKANI